MPFKFNAACHHHFPRARYRVRNWPGYEAGLKRRGDLTLWIDEAALGGGQAPRRNKPGGQAIYSDLAIEMVVILPMVFHLALHQAEASVASDFGPVDRLRFRHHASRSGRLQDAEYYRGSAH